MRWGLFSLQHEASRNAKTMSTDSIKSAKTPVKTSPAAARVFGRAANWAVGVAAAVLVLTSVGGYFYHREQLSAIAADHLRLIVTGPSTLQNGAAAEFMVSTTTISGQPVPAQIEVALLGPDGNRLKAFKEPADEHGRLRVLIPADLNLPPQCKLKVGAWHGDSQEETEMPLLSVPARLATEVSLDKAAYRPGETIRCRSVTLSWFGLEACRQLPVHFALFGPRQDVTPISTVNGTTDHGVGSGAFVLAENAPHGLYELSVQSPDRAFDNRSQHFGIRKQAAAGSDRTAEAAHGEQAAADELKVTFYPEGGELIAGLENRVYFSAKNARGEPVALSGVVVVKGRGESAQDREVAAVETMFQGMGTFSLTPRAGETYRLRIAEPKGAKQEPTLPSVVSDSDLVLTTGTGVFAAEKPLEFNVRAAKAGISLVAAAYCRGVQVGEQPLVTKAGATAANPVVIPLDRSVGGVIRLIVFDYRTSPPKPVAERLVYRRPSQKLNVQAIDLHEKYAPGEKVELSFAVTDEKGEAVPGVLGIEAVDEVVADPTDSTLSTQFLLLGEINNPETVENADFYLSDGVKDKTPAAVALDLLLGVQNCQWHGERSFRAKGVNRVSEGELAPMVMLDDLVGPPAMFDNVHQIRANYEKSMADYQAVRTNTLNTLTTASFFGGLGLVLLVAMLGLMRIVSGMHLWIAAIGATTCCLIVGAILMDPGRLATAQDVAVAFSSYTAPSPKLDKSKDREPRPTPSPEQSVPIAKPAAEEKTGEPQPETKQAKAEPKRSTLLWAPLLVADADGKASVSFELPKTPSKIRVTVNAQGAGRLGSGQFEIVTRETP